jgi:hypothetical protein
LNPTAEIAAEERAYDAEIRREVEAYRGAAIQPIELIYSGTWSA